MVQVKSGIILLFFFGIISCTSTTKRIYTDQFENDLSAWVAEYNHDSTVLKVENSQLEIIAPGGVTLWFKEKLKGDLSISYEAMIIDEGGKYDRASDLNCFWMANDPQYPDDLFARSAWRNGVFGNYYSLSLYYVGLGGNNNTTTRFRKYDGDYESFVKERKRPEILGEYTDKGHLITPNVWCKVEIVMSGNKVQYKFNGEIIFDYTDTQPFHEGYFGLRTVKNHMKIQNFNVVQFIQTYSGK